MTYTIHRTFLSQFSVQFSLTFFLLLLSPVLLAQKAAIYGLVQDENLKEIPFATVLLFQIGQDTSMSKAMASDANGAFSFEAISQGKYFIESTFIGYEKKQTAAFKYNGNSALGMPTIILKEEAQQLEDVVIKATRPLVEVQPDKTVFNVEGSVNAVGNTGLELLRKSPGVVVDNNENLILQGKSGVTVYIDGKKSPLRGNDLSNYLKNLNSTDIDAIEIITNPSAKYDAEGNAGIINIRLVKKKNVGTNGSVNAGINYGLTPKYSTSLNLNHRNENMNIFGSLSGYKGQHENDFFLYREQGEENL